MDFHKESVATAIAFENTKYSHGEDSGYHTFTPGSFESPDSSRDIFGSANKLVTTITGQIQIECHVTPEIQLHHFYNNSSTHERSLNTPPVRRGLKRSYSVSESGDVNANSVPTPTSFIAGKIQSLHFQEIQEAPKLIPEPNHNLLQPPAGVLLSQYPTTPIKSKCKGPCKRSLKKLDFTTHSILCEPKGLHHINKSVKKSIKKPRLPSKARTNLFKYDSKLDIISRLHEECGTGPPIMKILSFVSCEDILNFNLVSRKWNDIWESISEDNEMKQKYWNFLRIQKENQENKLKGITPKRNDVKPITILKEIQNDIKDNKANVGSTSPPGTPKSNKFKKFTKSASLDSRLQMCCVRCSQPGKVTEEPSGEVWVECTSLSCAYKFCKHCTCDRHPGKFCFQYDLNGPSPSKRKKTNYGVCSKKSRRNLHRLL